MSSVTIFLGSGEKKEELEGLKPKHHNLFVSAKPFCGDFLFVLEFTRLRAESY